MAGIYGYKPMPQGQRVGSWGYKPPKVTKPPKVIAGVAQGGRASPTGSALFPDRGTTAVSPAFRPTTGNTGPRTSAVPWASSGPDYGTMIGGDWEVQDAEAAMGAGMARARGDFQAGLRAALIDLGISDTSKLGSLGKYIDKDTISKAVQNKYSATAQSQQQATRARATNNAALAARGLLSSGQTTKSQEDVLAAQESANYMGLRDFLAGGASGLTGLADREEQYARGIASARAAAAQRAAEMAYWDRGMNGGWDAWRHPAEGVTSMGTGWRGVAAGLGLPGTTGGTGGGSLTGVSKPKKPTYYGYTGGQHLYPSAGR